MSWGYQHVFIMSYGYGGRIMVRKGKNVCKWKDDVALAWKRYPRKTSLSGSRHRGHILILLVLFLYYGAVYGPTGCYL